jgi:hypothetical protein
MTAVNVAPLWAILNPLIVAAVTGFVGWLSIKLNAWLQQHKCSAAQDDLDQALAHVPALAANELASLGAHNSAISTPSAIATVANIVTQMAPGIVTQLKMTPETVQAVVSAKLNSIDTAKPAATVTVKATP